MAALTGLRQCLGLAAVAGWLPATARAHVFVEPYALPIPLSLYAGAVVAALLMSFVVFAAVVRPDPSRRPAQPAFAEDPRLIEAGGRALKAGRFLALGLLGLTISAALAGSRNPYDNIGMTLFWICFVLILPYATAIVGDVYAGVNPWRTIVRLLERGLGLRFRARLALPADWRHLPALALYLGFIWIELFGQFGPRGLGWALLAYTLINVLGAWLLGAEAWFRNGEFFGVLLRIAGSLSVRVPGFGRTRASWRPPLAGLANHRSDDLGVVLFITAMLATTSFDGLHGTAPFSRVFWAQVYPVLAALFPVAQGETFAWAARLYYFWQWALLVLAPLACFGLLAAAAAASRALLGRSVAWKSLVLELSVSLVPVALAYHAAHYFTLPFLQAGQLLKLASDPFGRGWDLLGTAGMVVDPVVLDVEFIWHAQVALILVGHVAGAFVAHRMALRSPVARWRTVMGQLPPLVLMVLMTAGGLWILSLPIAPGGA